LKVQPLEGQKREKKAEKGEKRVDSSCRGLRKGGGRCGKS